MTPKIVRKPLPFLLFCSAIFQLQAQNWSSLIPQSQIDNPKIKFFTTKESANLSLEPFYLQLLASQFNATTFVETGTWRGNTTSTAAQFYNSVISIEISPEMYLNACRRFANTKNIQLHLGDSSTVLHEIINQIPGKPVFYLDAHYCGAFSGKGEVNCPIIAELKDIQNSKHAANSIILIDDIRFFYENDPSFYPSLNSTVELINQMGSYQFIQVFDQLVAFPADISVSISPVVRACTISRLYDGTNFDIDEVIQSEFIIAAAKNLELNTIYTLANQFTGNWKNQDSPLAMHHPLWLGLVQLNQGDFVNAYNNFTSAQERGLTHWRVEWYKTLAKNRISTLNNPNYDNFQKSMQG
jgi:hypothetical protein